MDLSVVTYIDVLSMILKMLYRLIIRSSNKPVDLIKKLYVNLRTELKPIWHKLHANLCLKIVSDMLERPDQNKYCLFHEGLPRISSDGLEYYCIIHMHTTMHDSNFLKKILGSSNEFIYRSHDTHLTLCLPPNSVFDIFDLSDNYETRYSAVITDPNDLIPVLMPFIIHDIDIYCDCVANFNSGKTLSKLNYNLGYLKDCHCKLSFGGFNRYFERKRNGHRRIVSLRNERCVGVLKKQDLLWSSVLKQLEQFKPMENPDGKYQILYYDMKWYIFYDQIDMHIIDEKLVSRILTDTRGFGYLSGSTQNSDGEIYDRYVCQIKKLK